MDHSTNHSAEFDQGDQELLAQALREQMAVDATNAAQDPQATELASAPAAAPAPEPVVAASPAATPPAPSPQATAPAAPASNATATAPAAAPVAAPAPAPEHHLQAALRVSRREADRLREQLEALKKSPAPAAAPAIARPSEEDLAEVAQFDPKTASYLADLEKQNRELAQAAQAAKPAATAQQAEFEPVRFNAATQEVIDSTPALMAMWLNPDQTAFTIACKQDAVLETLPAWKDKPLQERFAEAARRAAIELGQPTASPSPPAASQADIDRARALATVQAAGGNAVVTIGDLRGGEHPGNELPNYSKMTDEQIMASLR